MKKILVWTAILFTGCATEMRSGTNRSLSSVNEDPTVMLTCNPDEKTGAPEFTVRAGANGTYAWSMTTNYGEPKTTTDVLRLVGKANIDAKYGDLVGVDPIALFASLPGDAKYGYVDLASRKGKTDAYAGEYRNSHGGGDLTCSPGPAFATLAAAVEAAPAISKNRYSDAQDTVLAASCRKAGDKEDTYALRAMHYGFGSVSVQLNPKGPPAPGAMSDFDKMTFGKTGVLVFKGGESMALEYDTQTLGRVYLERKTIAGPHGEKQHRVILAPDLKAPEKPLIEMKCTEAQAYSTIEQFAKEGAQMPKALPSKPGTLAQVDRSLCGDENEEKASERSDKWSRLVMGMKLPGGAMITSMRTDSTKDTKCPILTIGVSTRAGADAIRKILGDTLDGMRIGFDVGEEHQHRGGDDDAATF